MAEESFIKKLRCLRTQLSPLLSANNLQVLEEAERRLTGEVSTSPPLSKNSQGARITKHQAIMKYYHKH